MFPFKASSWTTLDHRLIEEEQNCRSLKPHDGALSPCSKRHANRLVEHPTLFERLVECLVEHLVEGLVEGLIKRLVEHLVERLVECLDLGLTTGSTMNNGMNVSFNVSQSTWLWYSHSLSWNDRRISTERQ